MKSLYIAFLMVIVSNQASASPKTVKLDGCILSEFNGSGNGKAINLKGVDMIDVFKRDGSLTRLKLSLGDSVTMVMVEAKMLHQVMTSFNSCNA